ncbi:unnamed protein product [Protopolystoma xenopodis]|uniref:Uncharacterized protein n=1 Tax=Protopolystoma xenopodis TaxID=117903 RepID=A0A3S4ZGE3_9PLAT|nr:unnamed protein product [Protopolystoma xenopodis]
MRLNLKKSISIRHSLLFNLYYVFGRIPSTYSEDDTYRWILHTNRHSQSPLPEQAVKISSDKYDRLEVLHGGSTMASSATNDSIKISDTNQLIQDSYHKWLLPSSLQTSGSDRPKLLPDQIGLSSALERVTVLSSSKVDELSDRSSYSKLSLSKDFQPPEPAKREQPAYADWLLPPTLSLATSARREDAHIFNGFPSKQTVSNAAPESKGDFDYFKWLLPQDKYHFSSKTSHLLASKHHDARLPSYVDWLLPAAIDPSDAAKHHLPSQRESGRKLTNSPAGLDYQKWLALETNTLCSSEDITLRNSCIDQLSSPTSVHANVRPHSDTAGPSTSRVYRPEDYYSPITGQDQLASCAALFSLLATDPNAPSESCPTRKYRLATRPQNASNQSDEYSERLAPGHNVPRNPSLTLPSSCRTEPQFSPPPTGCDVKRTAQRFWPTDFRYQKPTCHDIGVSTCQLSDETVTHCELVLMESQPPQVNRLL